MPARRGIYQHMPNPPKQKATLFLNGRSQAVRLPKSLRFDGDEVYVWKEGERVILEPVRKAVWPEGYWEALDAMNADLPDDIELKAPELLDLDL